MMRFNSKRLFLPCAILIVIGAGVLFGVLVGNGFSSPERNRHRSGAFRYRNERSVVNKEHGRTERRVVEDGARLRLQANDPHPIASDKGQAGNERLEDPNVKVMDDVLSEIIGYIEEESSSRKAGILTELKYARAKGNAKLVANLLRRIAFFNRGRKSGTAAKNALARLSQNAAFGGGLAGFLASGAQGGNGGHAVADAGGGNAQAQGGADEANGVENVVADEDNNAMTFEEFEAMIRAKEALRTFQSELSNCGSEAERIGKIKAKMMTLDDKSSCNTLAMGLINSSDKAMAVRATVDLVTSGNSACQESGKSAYQWLTGEKWAGAEAGMEQAAALEQAAARERSGTYRED